MRNSIIHEGKRIIAVDPKVIPLGSLVRVELENGDAFLATAQDIGSAIKGKRIDVLVKTKEEAYTLGRQQASIKVLRREGN